MSYQYSGGKQPIRLVYVSHSRFKGCQSIKGRGRGRRASLVLTVEYTSRKQSENLSFTHKDAAVMVQAVALTLREAGYRGSEFAYPSEIQDSDPDRPKATGAPPRLRRSRRLSLDSFIDPGMEVSERGGPQTLRDPEEVEPEVVAFVQANLVRILRPLQDAAVPGKLVQHVRDEVLSLSAILVKALREADCTQADE